MDVANTADTVEWTSVLDCPVAKVSLPDVVHIADRYIAARRPHYIAVVNAAKLVKMRSDSELRESVLKADVVGADGVPVVWASRLLGRRLPGRVNGTDLMEALLEQGNRQGYRIFFFGAKPAVLTAVLDVVRERYPGVQIAGAQHGYFALEEEASIVQRIHDARPDILLIAFGTPKKELWVKHYLHAMQVPVCHGVGGSFDVLAGVIPRAPHWMQRAGLEWLFRLLQEPRRMWHRYLVTNTLFILYVFQEWVSVLFGTQEKQDTARQLPDPHQSHEHG